ncbi:hypothetical protein KC340_g10278 [Hortaea werneckii]|nr:hypothetical protein KC342_g4185 [Hortaea werneckii]KAI7102236.1 hypothetical protein KC339_g6171 [Hortaea werneckii]KAI7206237.1 hypothetical protein KC365_g17296 [Hortaea werneckii]KAI7311153.1 hypothetical protein KC340_g10278 [Hortaea werneckii]KAI7375757.1 hypothetical protein KC328_g15245 [Hortaea werneckii]
MSLQQPTDRPAAPCVLSYLNEGGANFVFRIQPQACQDPNVQLHGRVPLLRIRKDLSHVQTAEEQLRSFDQHFKPLFSAQNLVEHEAVQLDDHVIPRLNQTVSQAKRSSSRTGDLMPNNEKYGLLITNMSPWPMETLVQFKPKWLSQSPNAPEEAKRCRTCALRAQRQANNQRTATDAQDNCPLAMISESAHDRRRAAEATTTDKKLQDYLVDDAQPLLRALKENQQRFDSSGVLGIVDNDVLSDICKAMSLRDCTLFLKHGHRGVEARLSDLDLKQPEKLDKWRAVEEVLINEGWYQNREAEEVWREEKVCLLSTRYP